MYGAVVVPDSGTAEYPSVECDADAADIKGELQCQPTNCMYVCTVFISLLSKSQ